MGVAVPWIVKLGSRNWAPADRAPAGVSFSWNPTTAAHPRMNIGVWRTGIIVVIGSVWFQSGQASPWTYVWVQQQGKFRQIRFLAESKFHLIPVFGWGRLLWELVYHKPSSWSQFFTEPGYRGQRSSWSQFLTEPGFSWNWTTTDRPAGVSSRGTADRPSPRTHFLWEPVWSKSEGSVGANSLGDRTAANQTSVPGTSSSGKEGSIDQQVQSSWNWFFVPDYRRQSSWTVREPLLPGLDIFWQVLGSGCASWETCWEFCD